MATLKDVAAAAGVSSATASRILNQDPSLSVQPATRQKVLAAAQELNYVKSPRIQAKVPFTLGILQWFSTAQETEDSYYLAIRQGIESYCQEQRIPVIRTFKNDLDYMTSLKNADGLIGIGKFSETEIAAFQSITPNLLLIDMPSVSPDITTITLDFVRAVEDILDHLTALGHRHIGYLGGIEYLDSSRPFSDLRKKTFIDYCRRHDLVWKPYVYEEHFSVESGYHMMSAMIESGKLPTAVFAASDPIAIGAMRALQDRDLSVPDDISLVGFNDTSLSAFTTPPLTTVHAPSVEMGRYGALLVRQMADSSVSCPLRIQVPCPLIIRQSCAAPKHQ